jgi:hypothetical protein
MILYEYKTAFVLESADINGKGLYSFNKTGLTLTIDLNSAVVNLKDNNGNVVFCGQCIYIDRRYEHI